MDPIEDCYWPFDVLPSEQRTERDWEVIRFLESAYLAGYQPYTFGSGSYGATAGSRAGEILYRGRRGRHWQLCFVDGGKLVLSAHVDDWNCATGALLRWLGGATGAEALDHVRGNLLITPATVPGFVLHDQKKEWLIEDAGPANRNQGGTSPPPGSGTRHGSK